MEDFHTFANAMKQISVIKFHAETLLADAEVTICKYKLLIISVNAFVLG